MAIDSQEIVEALTHRLPDHVWRQLFSCTRETAPKPWWTPRLGTTLQCPACKGAMHYEKNKAIWLCRACKQACTAQEAALRALPITQTLPPDIACPDIHCGGQMGYDLIKDEWTCRRCGAKVRGGTFYPAPAAATGCSLALPGNAGMTCPDSGVPVKAWPVEKIEPKPLERPEECDCGGPPGHVPNGILCRRPA
jgi:ribosomal protein L37AE/L43A